MHTHDTPQTRADIAPEPASECALTRQGRATAAEIAAGLSAAQREALLNAVVFDGDWQAHVFIGPLLWPQTIDAMQRRGLFERRTVTPLGLEVRAILLQQKGAE